MKILLSGSNGLVGSELKEYLNKKGYQVINLVRNKNIVNDTSVYWDYENEIIDFKQLKSIDCVIHLAGENISAKRWSDKQKHKILESRVKSTNFLIESLSKLDQKSHTFICASAVGFYGNRGKEILTEQSERGTGFLSDVCAEWEGSTNNAKEIRMRIINLRFGVIMSEKGGALKKMITLFKFGLGGKISSGNQYVSWISLEDTIRSIDFCLHNEKIKGPINIVSPNPVTNKEMTKILGRYLKRPTLFPLPEFAAKLILGEMADELLLASTKAEPKILIESEFEFKHNRFEDILNY